MGLVSAFTRWTKSLAESMSGSRRKHGLEFCGFLQTRIDLRAESEIEYSGGSQTPDAFHPIHF